MMDMVERTITRVTLTSKNSQSLRTVIPRSVCKKMNLQLYDMLEWVNADKNQVLVMKRQLK